MKIYKYNSTNLQFEVIPYLAEIFRGLAIFLILFIFIGATSETEEDNYIIEVEDILLVDSQNEFSEDKFVCIPAKKINELILNLDYLFNPFNLLEIFLTLKIQ